MFDDDAEAGLYPAACRAEAETPHHDIPALPDVIEAAIRFGRDRDWWTVEEFKAGDVTVRYHPHVRDLTARHCGISDSDIAGMFHRCARFECVGPGQRFRLALSGRCAACQRTRKPQGS